MLSFNEFVKTKQHIDLEFGGGIQAYLGNRAGEQTSGFLYAGYLYIEEPNSFISYALMLGNQDWIADDIEDLEDLLYDYYIAENEEKS